jgi:hypothetical protein
MLRNPPRRIHHNAVNGVVELPLRARRRIGLGAVGSGILGWPIYRGRSLLRISRREPFASRRPLGAEGR